MVHTRKSCWPLAGRLSASCFELHLVFFHNLMQLIMASSSLLCASNSIHTSVGHQPHSLTIHTSLCAFPRICGASTQQPPALYLLLHININVSRALCHSVRFHMFAEHQPHSLALHSCLCAALPGDLAPRNPPYQAGGERPSTVHAWRAETLHMLCLLRRCACVAHADDGQVNVLLIGVSLCSDRG